MAKRTLDKDIQLKAAIKGASQRALIRVDSGLYLQLRGGDSASWLYRFQLSGRRREMGLGSYPEVSLADAKDKARDAGKLIEQGQDPIEVRKARDKAEAEATARAIALETTFDTCALDYIELKRKEWKNKKHADQWTNTLKEYVSPVIGKLPVGSVTTEHVLEILKPIWTSKTETATRVRARVEIVLDAAKVKKLRTGENPALWRGHLDKILSKPSKVRTVKHHAALPFADLSTFWPTLAASTHMGAPALQFLILTATRTSEVVNAEWSEFDLATEIWTIPANRLKAGKEHIVPLTRTAIAVLKAQEGRDARYVFPGRSKGRPISTATMAVTLSKLERTDITVHGFRSTFRDWCAEETHHSRDVCEMALAHAVESSVEAAYRRGDLLKKRRVLMQDWEVFIKTTPAPNVVKFKRRSKRGA